MKRKKWVRTLTTIKDKFEFLPKEVYENLKERDREKLLKFNRDRYQLERKENKVRGMEIELQKEKDLIKEKREDLINLHNQISHLRSDFYFTCSVVSYKTKYNQYYNLLISRSGLPNKSVSLGNEDKIKDHLLKSYKGTKKISDIKKDWKTFLKVESNVGDVYKRIMTILMKNPQGFNEQKGGITLTKNDILPIKKGK